eukprot:Lankesteria_metandrocarpae@DN4294_c0_g1_i1.p1
MPPKQKARQVNSNNTESSNRNCKIPADEWRVIILMIDIYTLCRLRATCNELYNLADEQKLWAERCLSRFPHPDLYSVLPAFDADWRRMFFAKRRLRLDGIYISRCSVVRYVRATGNIHLQGEKGPITHDGAAKTIVIHYGRYLKFVDAKRVIVARSTQTESEVVSVIKMIDEANRKRNTAQQINGMTRGRFGFQNNSYYDIVASSNQQNHRGSLLDIPPRGACTTTGTSGPNDTDLMPKIADLGVGSAEISCVQFVRVSRRLWCEHIQHVVMCGV